MAVPLTLKVFKGDALVASRDYDRDIIKIGRLASAHLCLEDEKVSRIHSVIEVAADGTLSIIDMGSVEGTFVNGKRVNKGALAFGDEIRVGNTTIRLENPAAVAAANLQESAASAAPEPAAEAPAAAPEAPAEGLARAAAAAAPSEALDPSFAATERNVVVPAPAPAAARPQQAAARPQQAAPAAAPARKVAAPQPAAPAPRPRAPAARKAKGPLGLALRLSWGDQRVGEHYFAPGKPAQFTVGSASGVDFPMGDGRLAGEKFTFVKADAQGFTAHFTAKMKGQLTRRGQTLDLKAALEAGHATHDGDAYALALEPDDFLWVDLGGITAELAFQPAPKPVLVPWTQSMDFTSLNIFLVLFAIFALFVISAANRSEDDDAFADELSDNQARIAKLIIKPPEVKKNRLLEQLSQQKEKKQSGEMAAKARGDEGQMGKKDAPKTNNRTAPKGDPNKKDEARAMAARLFAGKGGGLSTVFGKGGLGGELKSAMGNMFGAKAGDSKGFGGLGLRGSGNGGGGTGDTIGIGGVGTKGRGGGTGSYGTGVGVLGGKGGVDIGITAAEPEVMGSLDKELIRQVIQRNRGQIRYCYESQLTRFPNLTGKVSVKWVITPDGTVASSVVTENSARVDELGSCIAGRIRTWIFPKPKGGGGVIVNYPFNFKPSGQ